MNRSAPVPVGELKNIGPGIARRLEDIGIETRDDLEKATPAAAFRRLSHGEPGRRLPVCYYLYTLDAALKDCDWRDLGDKRKRQLCDEAGVDPG